MRSSQAEYNTILDGVRARVRGLSQGECESVLMKCGYSYQQAKNGAYLYLHHSKNLVSKYREWPKNMQKSSMLLALRKKNQKNVSLIWKAWDSATVNRILLFTNTVTTKGWNGGGKYISICIYTNAVL